VKGGHEEAAQAIVVLAVLEYDVVVPKELSEVVWPGATGVHLLGCCAEDEAASLWSTEHHLHAERSEAAENRPKGTNFLLEAWEESEWIVMKTRDSIGSSFDQQRNTRFECNRRPGTQDQRKYHTKLSLRWRTLI
jgi:hypothetical protein